jgi:hypothetical protein
VAIRAQENALSRLCTKALDASRHAFGGHSEILGAGVDVMELEGRQAAVVATKRATTAALTNQKPLYLTPPPDYRIPATPAAPVAATSVEEVLGCTVAWTVQQQLAQP